MTHPTEPRVVELLPCPFCGGTKAVTFEDDEIGAWFAQCRSHCDASVSGTTEQRAIAAWNTRTAAEAASRQEVARLREALGKSARLMDRAADWIDQEPNLRGPAEEKAHTLLIKALDAGVMEARTALAATDGEGGNG